MADEKTPEQVLAEKIQAPAPDDLGFLNPEDQPASAAVPPAEAVVPAAEAPVVPAPVPEKIVHPAALRRRALELFSFDGISPHLLDTTSTDDLFEWVRGREVALATKQTAPPTPEPTEAFDFGVDPQTGQPYTEADVSGPLLNVLKQQQKTIKELKTIKENVAQRDQAREAQSFNDIIDDATADLGAGYERLLGKGGVGELAANSPEFRRRQAIINAADIRPADSEKTKASKYKAAAKELFGELAVAPAAAPVVVPQPAPAPVNGKPRITKEQWDAAGAAHPTSRAATPKEEKGEKPAREAAREWLKANHMHEDDDVSQDLEGVPE